MIELFVSHGGDCNIPNSDGLTVTSSGSYSAVIKKGVTSNLMKGTTKVGEIKSDGWYVDGKKFVVEPLTLDLDI